LEVVALVGPPQGKTQGLTAVIQYLARLLLLVVVVVVLAEPEQRQVEMVVLEVVQQTLQPQARETPQTPVQVKVITVAALISLHQILVTEEVVAHPPQDRQELRLLGEMAVLVRHPPSQVQA
jgi:hypothetical protein